MEEEKNRKDQEKFRHSSGIFQHLTKQDLRRNDSLLNRQKRDVEDGQSELEQDNSLKEESIQDAFEGDLQIQAGFRIFDDQKPDSVELRRQEKKKTNEETVKARVQSHLKKQCSHGHEVGVSHDVRTNIKPVRYLSTEKCKFDGSVYNLTIAANYKNAGTHREFFFCVRQCVYVFIFQVSVAAFFGYQHVRAPVYRTSDWNEPNVVLRAVCALLL